MTQPVPQNAYLVANGTGTIYPTIIFDRPPTGNDLNHPITQRWIDTSHNNEEWFLLNFITTGGYYQANWVQIAGGGMSIETLTGNSGGAVSPTGNNINTLGTGSITIVGNPGSSTLTTQLTGLTDHSVLVGAGTATITNVGPSSISGAVFIGEGASADPAYSTTTSVNDSIGLLAVSKAINTGGPQIVLNNTSATTGATARYVCATDASGTGSDAYLLVNNNGSPYEFGVQGATGDFILQNNPTNTHPYMDGVTVLSMDQSGNFTVGQSGGTTTINTYTMPTNSGTNGYVLTTNGTNAASWKNPGLIFQGTFSEGAGGGPFVVDISSFSSRIIQIYFYNFYPLVNGDPIIMQVSNDGGGTWFSTGYLSGSNASQYNSDTQVNANATSYFYLAAQAPHEPILIGPANGTIYMNPNCAGPSTVVVMLSGNSFYADSSGNFWQDHFFGALSTGSVTLITTLRFTTVGGTGITNTSTVSMYSQN